MTAEDNTHIAFAGSAQIALGSLPEVALAAKAALDEDSACGVIVFDAHSSEVVDLDLRGTPEEILGRLNKDNVAAPPIRRPGRPRLGVVAREVTLLPRHWDWLNEQPGGASVTLRRLVEEARRAATGKVDVYKVRESCYRFMNTMAGDEPGFEETLRSLYASDRSRFEALTDAWPASIRDHARRLAEPTFDS